MKGVCVTSTTETIVNSLKEETGQIIFKMLPAAQKEFAIPSMNEVETLEIPDLLQPRPIDPIPIPYPTLREFQSLSIKQDRIHFEMAIPPPMKESTYHVDIDVEEVSQEKNHAIPGEIMVTAPPIESLFVIII